jgi:hypothetical protein
MSRKTKKRSSAKKNKRKSRKNIGRGYSLAPLKSTNRTPSSTRIRSITQLRRQLSNGRSVSNTTRKRVQINTPENIVQEYSLGSSEKRYKKNRRITGITKCVNPTNEDDFPCKLKNTVFRTKKDYDKFKIMKRERNESTGYKSRSEHYDDIESILTSQGSELLRK